MRQCSLFDEYNLATALSAIRAAMRRVASNKEGDGRKKLVDGMNAIAKRENIPLTGGTVKGITSEILDKLLSNDASHPPGVNFILVFCEATKDFSPLCELLKPFGLDLMTPEAKRLYEIAKADEEIRRLKKRKKMLEES